MATAVNADTCRHGTLKHQATRPVPPLIPAAVTRMEARPTKRWQADKLKKKAYGKWVKGAAAKCRADMKARRLQQRQHGYAKKRVFAKKNNYWYKKMKEIVDLLDSPIKGESDETGGHYTKNLLKDDSPRAKASTGRDDSENSYREKNHQQVKKKSYGKRDKDTASASSSGGLPDLSLPDLHRP